MKKFYRIFFLFLVFIILSTYGSKNEHFKEQDNKFFVIKSIKIENTSLIKKEDINEKLKHILGKNIFYIKTNEINEPIKNTNFLKKIEVKKKYPDTIIIKIFETKPLAVINKGKDKYILDSMSNLVASENKKIYKNLPIIFGDYAEKHFINFFQKLSQNNFPKNRIKFYYYFKIGRWDLKLLNNKIIKLPSKKIDKAIKKSIDLLNREDFINYNIIDLRVDGKIIVE